jgi:MscS family membrane protein
MRTFLEAFDATKSDPTRTPLEQAASCLDLSQIRKDLRRRQGPELASQLKEVLDHTVLIDFSTIPDSPTGSPWVLDITDAGEVSIAADARGVWLFTPKTVERIPDLFRQTGEREKVEGVVDTVPLTPSMWLRSQVPATLLGVTFFLEHWQWLGLLALVLLGFILDYLLTAAVQTTIERYLERRMETVPPEKLKRALRPLGLLASALLWLVGIFWLGLPTRILEMLLVAVHFIAAVAFVGTAYRMVEVVASVLEQRAARTQNKFDDLLVPLFRKSTKLMVTAFGVLFIAETLSLPVRSVIAGLGIGGLALALAAQDVVKNIFGSLTVIVDRPFAVGDWVVIEGVEGTVAELGFRSTRIRTFYDSIVTVPNSNLINASVDNYGQRRYRRWSTFLSLTYDTPPEKIEAFCEGLRELIRQHPNTRKDYFEVHLNRFSAASLDVLLYVFFTVPDWSAELRERHRLGTDILRLAVDLGVEFAFPTQTLYLKRPEMASQLPPTAGTDEYLEQIHQDARRRARRLTGDTAGQGAESFQDPPGANTGAETG